MEQSFRDYFMTPVPHRNSDRLQRRGNAIQIGLFHSMFKLLANQQELFGDAFGVCCLGFFEINRETS